MAISIILADDHRMMREGLRTLLERQPGTSVVAEAEDGRQAVKLCIQLRPDLVLMDISMPELNGIEATRQITRAAPKTKVVALSMQTDRRFVADMLAAGASGYLLKDSAFEELVRAVEVIGQGHTYLSPAIATTVVEDFVRRPERERGSMARVLSGREREVLQLLAEGWPTRRIAEKLAVSTKTVETHRSNIKSKLKLKSLAELTKYAVREGLTSL